MLQVWSRRIGLTALSILFLLGSIASFPALTVYAATDGDFEYLENADGTATITGYTGPVGGGVEIPEYVGGGLTVVEIGDRAFMNKQLTSIDIPDRVMRIGVEAFHTNNLTHLNLPSTLTTIGNAAFKDNELVSLTIPEGVTNLGEGAFEYNNLTHLVLPSSLAAIGRASFKHNELASLTIPEGVTTIGIDAFHTNNLTHLNLPSTLTTIENAAFKDNELVTLALPEGVTTIGIDAFARNKLTNVNFPDTLTTIANAAFMYNELVSLTIPEGVTTIGIDAFHTNNLTHLNLPSTLTTIENAAFKDNELASLTIPEGVTTIGIDAFHTNNLTHLNLPSTLTTIENAAFKDNELVTLALPANVTTVLSGAFQDNSSLKDVLVLNPDIDFSDVNIFAGSSSDLTLYSYEASNSATFAAAIDRRFQTITAELADLKLNIDGLTFDPAERAFHLLTNAYSVIVTPTAVVTFSEITVNSVRVPNGEDSAPIALNESTSTIIVEVEAPDHSTEEYTIVFNVDHTSPTIEWTAAPTTPTNGIVTVTVDAADTGSGISELKWASGNQDETFFATDGQELTGDSFDVTANGTYTVYARDEAGNEAIEIITISNIVVTPPTTPDPDSGENSDGDEDNDPRTIIKIKPGVIIIEVAPRDIKEVPKVDGGVKEVVALPDDLWDELPKLLDEEDRTVIRVIIDEHQPDVEVLLPSTRLAEVMDVNPSVRFDVQLSGSSFQLKVNILDFKQLSEQLGIAVDDMNVIIQISALTGEIKEEFIRAAEEQGMSLLSQLIEFQLIISGGDKRIEITDFGGTYMTKSIMLDDRYANRNYMAVLYDPIGLSFTYVPAVMEQRSNGGQDAWIQMPHNSIYAVVEADVIDFADMQGHWAENEVEHLGSKRIVKGTTARD